MADPEKESPEEVTEEPAADEAEVQAAPEDLVVEDAAARPEESSDPEAAAEAEPIDGEAVGEEAAVRHGVEAQTDEEHAQFEPVEEHAPDAEEGGFAPVDGAEHHGVFGEKSDSPADAAKEHADVAEALGGVFSGVFGGSSTPSPSAAPILGGASASTPPPQPQGGGSGFMLLLTWASLATILAFWLWYTRPPVPSALEDLPDDGKLQLQSSSGKKQIVLPTEALSDRLTIPLNQTRRIGDLEITPRSVEYRRAKLLSDTKRVIAEPMALALKLELKNVGKDYAFHPADPQFLHLVERGTRRVRRPLKLNGEVVFEDGYSYTFLHPTADVNSAKRRILPYDLSDFSQHIEGESFAKLKPGESTATWVFSEEDCIDKVQGQMVWRVKLRKGVTRRGKGVGVATVIGVPFSRDQVVDKSKDEQET